MEILYTVYEKDSALTGIIGIIAGIVFVVIFIISITEEDNVSTAAGVMFIIGLITFTISLGGICARKPKPYVYARISSDTPYIQIIENYEFIEHQDDVYKLKVINKN